VIRSQSHIEKPLVLCAEIERLLEAYHLAVKRYAAAILDSVQKASSASNEDLEILQNVKAEARSRSAQAKLALAEHRREHG
jgi:hypothetical protein